MPRIDTIEELMVVLDEHPQWLEALRTRLLTRELIELPRRFAEFAASVDQNFAHAGRRMDGMEQRIGGMEQAIGGMQQTIGGMQQTMGEMNERMDGMSERMDTFATKDQQQKIVDEVGTFKGFLAERSARADAPVIAMDLGLKTPRLLSRAEAAELAYSPALAHLSRGERISFRRADALIEAVDDAGETCYVAVEASYTAAERDTARALRNADWLAQATGRPARAVVACVHADDRIRSAVESGAVHRHELPDYRDSADFE